MQWLLDFIRPPEDAEWKTVNRWRWNVAMTLLVLSALVAWAYGPKGFAGDALVDQKIADAQRPLMEAQKKTNDKVDRMSTLLMNQLANSKAAEIRLNISKRCKSNSIPERDYLAAEKDRLQEEYISLKGVRYVEPTCAEL
jgi:hypothetical protein